MQKETTNRIDELGRILIPNFTRVLMQWRAKDLLTITANPEEGTVTLSLAEIQDATEEEYATTPQ